MLSLHLERDLIDEEASHERGDRRHEQHRADHNAETGGEGKDPRENDNGRMRARAQCVFQPVLAIRGEPDK
jgi:hypothetical protein